MSKLPAIEVRPIGLDSLAELRHIHSRSYRSYLCCDLSQDQLDALLEYVATPAYLDLVPVSYTHLTLPTIYSV